MTTLNAVPGIYTLWIQGQAGSPYLTTKWTPAAIKVGTVSRDFSVDTGSTIAVAPVAGNTVTFALKVKREGSAFNGTNVNLSLDGPLPTGIGAVTFSPSNVVPGNGNGNPSTLTINTGTMAPGRHRIVLRGTGVNGDGQKVTHLFQLFVDVATGGGANDNYIDIVGFAVMRIAAMDANTVSAYAITPVIADMNDPRCAAVRWRGWCPGTSRAGTAHRFFRAARHRARRPDPGRHRPMEMEYKDPSKRGKFIVILGVVLALAAGGAAFFLINQAQQQAGQSGLKTVSVVVAARPIPARKPVEADDVAVRQVPLDPTNSDAIIIKQPDQVIGRVLAVSVLQDQMITLNMLASTAAGGQFSILEPGESIAPGSQALRAVSLTVPDDRAVGGLLVPGMTVDVFTSATVNVPQDLIAAGKFYTDKSTKITYQNMVILARAGTFYVVRASVAVAEEISHLQASGNATFSLAMRPEPTSCSSTRRRSARRPTC